MRTEQTESMSVVDKDAERIFLLESDDLIQLSERSGHAVNTLGDKQDTSTVLISFLTSAGKNLLAILHVVVAVLVFAADMETDTVKQASVALGVIDDDIVTACQGINRGDDTLVAEIVKERVLFLLEISEYLLQFLVITGVAGHHSGSHRISQSPVCRRLGVRLADLRMVGESKIVVK